MNETSHELNIFELSQNYLMVLDTQLKKMTYLGENEKNNLGLEYSLLDNYTHMFFSSFNSSNGNLVDFFMIPMDSEKFPQNWKLRNNFGQDILPELAKAFYHEHYNTLQQFENKKFTPLDYGYPEKIELGEDNYNTIFLRVVWQSIQFWSKQENMSTEEKMICYQHNLFSLMLGNDLTPTNILVPILKPSEVIYLKNSNKNYTTSDNYLVLSKHSEVVVSGYALNDLLFKFSPHLDSEKVYQERYLLEQQLSAKKASKIKL